MAQAAQCTRARSHGTERRVKGALTRFVPSEQYNPAAPTQERAGKCGTGYSAGLGNTSVKAPVHAPRLTGPSSTQCLTDAGALTAWYRGTSLPIFMASKMALYWSMVDREEVGPKEEHSGTATSRCIRLGKKVHVDCRHCTMVGSWRVWGWEQGHRGGCRMVGWDVGHGQGKLMAQVVVLSMTTTGAQAKVVR